MSTARAHTDPFADDLAKVILGLMEMRGIDRFEVIEALSISQGTYYNRIADGNWTARQMAALADLLGVEVSRLFNRPEDLLQKLKFLSVWTNPDEVQGTLPFTRPALAQVRP